MQYSCTSSNFSLFSLFPACTFLPFSNTTHIPSAQVQIWDRSAQEAWQYLMLHISCTLLGSQSVFLLWDPQASPKDFSFPVDFSQTIADQEAD